MIDNLLKQKVEINGGKIFFTDIDKGIELSIKEFDSRVEELSLLLRENGINKGFPVLLLMDNCLEFMITFYALLRIKAVNVPVNPGIEDSKLNYIISDAGVQFIVVVKEQQKRDLGKLYIYHEIELTEHICLLKLERKLPENKPFPISLALLMYTSGSTGEPKGVLLTNENIMAEMHNIMEAHELSGQDRVLCLLPWYHINGLVITMLTPLLADNHMFLTNGFNAGKFWSQVEEWEITWFSGVPVFYSYLLAQKTNPKNNTLRFARSASSSLSISVIKQFEERFHVPLIESYGMTEGGSQLTTNPLHPKPRKIGSVGLPYGNKIKIIDSNWSEVGTSSQGEVIVSGNNITEGYWNKPQINSETFRDGWMKTGDIGYLDRDGYLYLTGRTKELINRMGEKFSPREIEEVLYCIDGVEIAGVVGIPHPLYGEKVVAFIKAEKGKSLSAISILSECRKKLMNFKIPQEIIFVDDFPLGSNGKMQRLKLKEQYNKIKVCKGEKV